MNVNFFPFSNSLQILGRRQSLANIMCNQQSVTQSRKKDLFVRNTMYDTGIYTASAGKRNKMISNSILSAMNNDTKTRRYIRMRRNIFYSGADT